MRRTFGRQGATWILLLLLLGGTVAAWEPWRGGACACVKEVACCCRRAPAGAAHAGMPKGSSCSPRRAAPCSVRTSEGAIVRTRTEVPVTKLIARIAPGALRPPVRPVCPRSSEDRAWPTSPVPEPLTPPPRPS